MRTPLRAHGAVTRVLAGLVLAVSMIGGSLSPRDAASATRALPQPREPIVGSPALLPETTCSYDAGTNTRTCEVWAKTGTLTLPDGVIVNIWGYADSAGGAAQIPGPTIIALEGETVEVVLHNDLSQTTSLFFAGQPMVPDLTGVASGAQATYSLDAVQPGTFLYEAGPLGDGARQVAMGLFGALVVRPSTGAQYVYNDASLHFDDEALVILSEIDPALNADPAGFRMQNYEPRYFLINGAAYPNTEPILTSPGAVTLLRQINAGLTQRSLGLLGVHQRVVGNDGAQLNYGYETVSESIGPGQTLDALVTLPVDAGLGAQYVLQESGLAIRNASQRLAVGGPQAFGGMLTFLTVPGTPPGVAAGPIVNNPQVVPDQPGVATSYTLTATVTDVATGGQNVTAAEYFLNVPGAPGTGTPLSGAFGTPTVDVSASLLTADLIAAGGPQILVYLRGQDSTGQWGAPNSVLLTVDASGPAISGLSASPNPTNASTAVTLTGTADDTASGGNNIAAAEYRLDGGAPQPIAVSTTSGPVAGLSATIPAATMAALPEGPHTVSVRGQDSLGFWGSEATLNLMVDKTGPTTSDVHLAPNALDLSGTPPATFVELRATITDIAVAGVQSAVTAGEYFFDTPRANGSGSPLLAQDGAFNGASEVAYFNIPIANFAILSQGEHTVLVHGRDAAGNWGAMATVSVTIDKGQVDSAGPLIETVTLVPNPTSGSPTVTLTARAADPDYLSNIAAAEWFIGSDPGVGNGTALSATDGVFDSTVENLTATIDVSGLEDGAHTLWVRASDTAGFWGEAVSLTLTKTSDYRTFLPTVGR